jgi:hypothetical protein
MIVVVTSIRNPFFSFLVVAQIFKKNRNPGIFRPKKKQCYQGKDIVFRFIIEYNSSLRDFGPSFIRGIS